MGNYLWCNYDALLDELRYFLCIIHCFGIGFSGTQALEE